MVSMVKLAHKAQKAQLVWMERLDKEVQMVRKVKLVREV